jgi:hypothetical protein
MFRIAEADQGDPSKVVAKAPVPEASDVIDRTIDLYNITI